MTKTKVLVYIEFRIKGTNDPWTRVIEVKHMEKDAAEEYIRQHMLGMFEFRVVDQL